MSPGADGQDDGGTNSTSNSTRGIEFDLDLVPWIDRPGADVGAWLVAHPDIPHRSTVGEQLEQFRRDGYVVLEGAIDEALIDAYLEDLGQLVAQHSQSDVLVNCASVGVAPIRELDSEDLAQPHLRFLDFHNASTAGKCMALNAPVVELLGHALGDTIVAMQSLTFVRGSQQSIHQDFAYVVADIPSHLAACWIALEDVHPDAGPVAYYPGSHRLPKFDFGNGLSLTPESSRGEADFAEHLHREARARNLPWQELIVKKGDVLVWHCALAHGGTPVRDPALTRKSIVFHYSTKRAYPRDRRRADVAPTRYWLNGACCYGDPTRPQLENTFCAFGPWPGETSLPET